MPAFTLFTVLALSGTPQGLLAQPADRVAPGPTASVDLAEFTSRSALRAVLLELRALESAAPRDFAITAELLGIVQDLAPNDVEVVRRRAEAAWNAGDQVLLFELSRRIVELDPADTVAQLRVITSRLGKMQHAEDRLAAYDALLGPRGESLDGAIRSRLALDSALLRRERGDEAGFIERLKMAMRLDATNKDAALLAYTFFTSRVDDRKGRIELLANLLYADPLDPKTLRLLRDELAAAGAWKAARRFHLLTRETVLAAGLSPADLFEVEGEVLRWQAEGPAKVVEILTKSVESERANARHAANASSGQTAGVIRPEDIRLDVTYEQVRMLAAFWMGPDGAEALKSAAMELADTVKHGAESLRDPTRRPQGMTAEAADEQARNGEIELHLVRLMTGTQDAAANEVLDALLKTLPEDDRRAVACRAWQHVAAGRDAEALATAPTAGGTLWSDLARAQALVNTGNAADAKAIFTTLANEYPLTILGAHAANQIRKLGGHPAYDQPAAEMETYAGTIPAWIDAMLASPRLTQSLHAEFDRWNAGALDRVGVKVRIRNVSPIPLGVGSARTINSRLFFGPNLQIGVRQRNDNAAGEVLEMDRRLRLLPGEEMSAVAHPDSALVGWLAEVGSDKPSRLRWRIIQGFEARSSGQRELGPGCVESTTSTLTREALVESRLEPDVLVKRIETGDLVQIAAVIVAARARVLGGGPGEKPDDASPIIAAALVKAYPGWSPDVRLLATSVLPPACMARDLAPLDALMIADADPRVRALAVVTRATEAAQLSAAQADADPRVAKVAKLHAERIDLKLRTFATSGVFVTPSRLNSN